MPATAISGATGQIDGDNTGATLEPGEGALLYDVDNSILGSQIGYGGGRTVWYAWTCPANGDYAFWTGAIDGSFDYLGLADSILTVLDGNDFSTATVITQDEYSDGAVGGQYPWSLCQFTAVSGNVYYVGVDGFNGTKPSAGGYSIDDTFEGPFTLYWGAAVSAPQYARNPVVLAVTATTATIQFDIYPDDPAGADYYADTTPTVVTSPSAHEATPFAWTTVTRTITGLTPNTAYDGRGKVTNSSSNAETSPVAFITSLADEFGGCPVLLDDFNQADCTAPANFDTAYTPGTAALRIFGNEVGIYRCDTYVRAYREGSPYLGASPFLAAADIWITLVTVDDKQDVGWGSGFVGHWFARSDSDLGEAQIIHWDGATETVLASVAQVFVDGDKLGFRWWANGDLTVYRFNGGVRTALVTAAAAVPPGTRPPYNNFVPVVGQGQDEAAPVISPADLFDLSAYGTTPAPVGSGCPEGTDKYVWSQAQWRCGYYGDTTCVAPIDCQQYWLDLTVFPHGRIDCYNDSWSMGDAPIPEAYFGGFGTGYAALPFYPQSPDYNTTFDDIDGHFGGFYVYDYDFAYKAYAAIQSSIDSVQAAFAGQGAEIITCTDPGNSKVSRGVIMPVPPSVGRMDDLWFSDGRCTPTRVFKPQIVRYR